MDQNRPQEFNKYNELGAYHWRETKPSWRLTYNPYLDARYKVALSLVPQIEENSEKLAVDLGCGDGYFSQKIGDLGYRVVGIDGDSSAVKLAKQTAKVSKGAEFFQRNILHTELPNACADLVVCLDVIEHLSDPDMLLKEMKRISKPDTIFIIGTPIRITEIPLDKYHIKEFFPHEFEQYLQNFFSQITIKKTHPIEYLAAMRKRVSFWGKKKNIWWNFINLKILITGKNPLLEENSEFPTYQIARCKG